MLISAQDHSNYGHPKVITCCQVLQYTLSQLTLKKKKVFVYITTCCIYVVSALPPLSDDYGTVKSTASVVSHQSLPAFSQPFQARFRYSPPYSAQQASDVATWSTYTNAAAQAVAAAAVDSQYASSNLVTNSQHRRQSSGVSANSASCVTSQHQLPPTLSNSKFLLPYEFLFFAELSWWSIWSLVDYWDIFIVYQKNCSIEKLLFNDYKNISKIFFCLES